MKIKSITKFAPILALSLIVIIKGVCKQRRHKAANTMWYPPAINSKPSEILCSFLAQKPGFASKKVIYWCSIIVLEGIRLKIVTFYSKCSKTESKRVKLNFSSCLRGHNCVLFPIGYSVFLPWILAKIAIISQGNNFC